MSKKHKSGGCLFWFLLLLALIAILGLYSFKSITLIVYGNKNIKTQKSNPQAHISRAACILLKTIELEGGYQNMPTDVANYNSKGELAGTNYGISAIALEQFAGFPVNRTHVGDLSKMEAAYIYYQNYYMPVKGDSIHSYLVCWLIVDSYVHSPAMCCWAVERTLNHFQFKENVTKEFSLKTIAAINRCDTTAFFTIMKQYRKQWYDCRKAQFPEFYNGWINRLNSINI